MSRFAPVVLSALLLLLQPGLSPSVHAAPAPTVLTNIASIQSLARAEAARQLPVRFQGALTGRDGKSILHFIQDDAAGIPVQGHGDLQKLAMGQHVEIEGTTQPLASGPSVKVSRVTPLKRVALPKPRPATVQDLLDERWEGVRVVVDGIVSLAGRSGTLPGDFVVGLVLQDGTVAIHIASLPGEAWVLKSVGTRLRITGICRPLINPRGVTTAASVLVTQSNQIERVQGQPPAMARPKSAPRPIRLLPHYHNDPSAGEEATIEGIVTAILSQRSFFLQDQSGGVLVRTLKPLGFQPGDRLLLRGLPRREFIPAAIIPEEANQMVFHAQDTKSLGRVALPKAQGVAPADLLLFRNNQRRLELDATLLGTARPIGSPSLQLTLQAGSSLLEALVRDAPTNTTLLPALGSRVRIQGVLDHRPQPDSDQHILRFYLATLDDLALLQAPPQNYAPVLGWAAGGLGALGLITLTWALTLRRSVRQRTAELVQANAAKSQFLANMSHEIRTPLHAMLGLVQVLDRQNVAPEQGRLLAHVQQAGKSLLRILNDILDFSRVEAGQLVLERRAFALPDLLAHLDALFRDSAQDRGLTWRVAAPSGDALEDNLLGDPVRVQQVLSNLAANALKFTERGLVEVSTRVVELTDTTARLRFAVTDTGPGLDPDTLARLFQPFTQGDASIQRRYGGTGLGLSICRKLVDLMDGTMGADSQPGRGSTFWVELPFERTREPSTLAQTQAAPAPARTPQRRLAGRRVLVVDDNRLNLELADWVLRQEGATSLLVESAEAALALLASTTREPPEAILMDLEMPTMDGLTTIRRLREGPTPWTRPIIACTAGPSAERRAAALAAGAQEFLAKPCDIGELVDTLARCLPPSASPAPADDAEPATQALRPAEPFPAIPGLDTHHAASVLRHDRALFEKLLRDFVRQFGDLPERLPEDLASGRAAQASRRLHQFRGIAGYLGAAALAENARALQLAVLADAPDLPGRLQSFLHQLTALLSSLRIHTATSAGEPQPAMAFS